MSRFRWLVPPGGTAGWLGLVSLISALVGLILAVLVSFLKWWPASDLWLTGAVSVVVIGAIIGLLHGQDPDLPARLARTHRDVPTARTPVVWAWAVLAFAGFATAVLVFTLEGTGGGVAVPSAIALAALTCTVAGLGAVARSLLGTTRSASESDTGSSGQSGVRKQREPKDPPYFVDAPISGKAADELSRTPVVDALDEAIQRLAGPTTAFIVLDGGWGSGKSSVLSLLRERMDEQRILHGTYTGFHFASRERLTESLFEVLATTIGARYATPDVGTALMRVWGISKPIADKASPFGLPTAVPSESDRQEHLRSLVASVPRPIVLLVEDVDRLAGADVLTLIATLTTAVRAPGIVCVLAMDRRQVEREMEGDIENPAEYLRKVANATIRVPPPPEQQLVEVLDSYIESVLKARGQAIGHGELSGISRGTWVTLVPTLRHAKQLANAFSAALGQIGGEVSARDILLMSLLEEFAPSALDSVSDDHDTWLIGRDSTDLMELLRQSDSDDVKRENRRQATAEFMPRRRGRAVAQVLQVLFPENPDEIAALRHQSVVHFEYFRRYVERRVAPGSASDQEVMELISSINSAGESGASDTTRRGLNRDPLVPWLDRMIVLADLIAPELRTEVIRGVASMSLDLTWTESMLLTSERARAQALIYQLLELGKADYGWQADALTAAVQASSSLEFARELVAYATREHNRILTDFEAFEQPQMRRVLASEIGRRLEDGLDPFETEARFAPFIVGALGDPAAAATWVTEHGRSADVVRGYTHDPVVPDGRYGIRWDELCASYQVNLLKDSIEPDSRLLEQFQAEAEGRPCG